MNGTEKLNILVVDDSPANLFSMRLLLRSMDANVITAGSGSEALALTLEHTFALILMDVNMPIMNGYQTAEKLKEKEESRYIPLIFVTAFDEGDRQTFEGCEMGIVEYIYKPIDQHILMDKLTNILLVPR